VEADSDNLGGWIARKVEIEDEDNDDDDDDDDNGGPGGGDEIRLEDAVLQAISPTALQIDEVTYSINADTEMRGIDGRDTDWTAFSPGDLVELRAVGDGNGGFIATRVELEQQGQPEIQEFRGVIDTINQSEIVIGGQSILLDADTFFTDAARNAVDFIFFSAGMSVEVAASGNPTDGWIAISVHAEDGNGGEQKFTGTIDSINEAAVVVGGTSFALTANTLLFDNSGNAVELSFFTAGMTVSVEAIGSDAEGWSATQLKEDIPE
jgi:hypothetical protein